MTKTVLALHNITKRFGPLLANDAISLDLAQGEVLALLGENGAGKSTLVSILFGHYTADAGQIEVFGQPLPPGDPKAALAAGIGMVHQHFTLADNLSVLDNIIMGTEPLWQVRTQRRSARERLLQVAQRFGLSVEPDALVGRLSVGERQRVEILKALYRGARILILDEPTAVLTPQESEALFKVLAQMVAQGLSIIFISHKLAEVLRVSHRVAVLRGGKLVAQAPAAGTSQAQLAQWMVGHAVTEAIRRPSRYRAAEGPAAEGRAANAQANVMANTAGSAEPQQLPHPTAHEVVCELRQVSTAPARERLSQVSLRLHAGEIVAIAGVSGNGQVALAEVLCGTRALTAGQALLGGRPLPSDPAALVAQGVARIPEDRHAVGVVGDLPQWENAISERLRSGMFGGFWIARQRAQAYAQALVQRFDVRGGGLFTAARSLSGGNMQKLILGRALLHPHTVLQPDAPMQVPRLIVAHQPTWGLDIGAVSYVQAQLLAARDAGAAVLLISDDLDEVLTLGDRVAVMHAGHLSAALPAGDWSREAMGLAMAGVPGDTHAAA